MELTCPKCHGVMRQYERGGITLDQCAECRGIFLDRGELDRLIDAESAWHSERSAPAPARAPYVDPSHRPSGHREYDRDHRQPRKKRGFMEELFD